MFKSIFPYLVLIIAVIYGTASNSFANSANGFTKLVPSIYSIITIILCMYLLSQVMKFLPVGITYATFAGLCIIGTCFVGIIKFSQIPSFSTIIGLMLIICTNCRYTQHSICFMGEKKIFIESTQTKCVTSRTC